MEAGVSELIFWLMCGLAAWFVWFIGFLTGYQRRCMEERELGQKRRKRG